MCITIQSLFLKNIYMRRKNAGRIQTKNEQYFGELGLYFFQVFFLILYYIFPNNHQQACIILTINQFNISKSKDSSHQKSLFESLQEGKNNLDCFEESHIRTWTHELEALWLWNLGQKPTQDDFFFLLVSSLFSSNSEFIGGKQCIENMP